MNRGAAAILLMSALSLVAGVALYSPPAALIVAAVLLFLIAVGQLEVRER
ncbi:MAG: hypothetical protein ACRDTG_29215 [Pseudonocardiaceae bacterium]